MAKKQLNKGNAAFLAVAFIMILCTAFAAAETDTMRPTILSVSPANNEMGVARNPQIFVTFSEDMNPSTINTNSFMVTQRTTPAPGALSSEYRATAIDGTVTYDGRTAIFTPKVMPEDTSKDMTPNQVYGNVFTITITSESKDLAGNSLSRDFVWSFTTGNYPFYTDATTSQLDQSPAPISGLTPAPTPVPVQSPIVSAPATATQAAASNFPWVWVIGGLLLLLLIALIFVLATNSKDTQATRSSPFGDVHPVIDMEGIGPEYNERLREIGITNTQQLWEEDAAKIARKTGAPVSSVKSWQQMAELASVKDIGPQYAELLQRSGIHTIAQLKNYDSNKLLKLIRKKQDSLKVNIQGNSPGHATVEHWINEANDHKYSAA